MPKPSSFEIGSKKKGVLRRPKFSHHQEERSYHYLYYIVQMSCQLRMSQYYYDLA